MIWISIPRKGESLEIADDPPLPGLFENLPGDVQERARTAYEQFREDPAHPGLRFKHVDDDEPLYSVRIGIHYRAVGLLNFDTITWFWIGSHTDYERLLSS